MVEHHYEGRNSEKVLHQSSSQIGGNSRVSESFSDYCFDRSSEKPILTMRTVKLNVRGLNGKAELVHTLVDSTHLDAIGLTETWARPTDRFILPMTYEALTAEPTENRRRGNARMALTWEPNIEGETVIKYKSLNTQLVETKFGNLLISLA